MSRVVLQKTLADNLRNNDHVIVTTNNMDGDNVTWPKVDKEDLTNNTNRVPSSKIVAELSVNVDEIAEDCSTIARNLNSLELSSAALSNGLTSITNGATGKIDQLSIYISSISSQISALFNHTHTRFIGVSETDPATGIITIDGIKYYISSDFDESNNGDIIFYRTNVLNHDQAAHAGRPATQDNTEEDIHHEPISAVTMLYAYIYSNGVLNDFTSVEIEDNEDTPTGRFQRFGYSFFQNLSTLIHDEDVCDYAAIQQKKIAGLTADLARLDAKDADLQRQITANKNNITSLSNIIKNDISVNYAKKTYVNGISSSLSSRISSDYATKTYVNQQDQAIRSAYIAADTTLRSDLNDTISRTRDNLSSTVSTTYISCSQILTSGTTNSNSIVMGAKYALTEINKRFLSSNIVIATPTDTTTLNSTTKVPAMKVLQEMKTSLQDLINSLSSNLEPQIGTLRYIANKSFQPKAPDASDFDGWVWANGQTITNVANKFNRAKAAFGIATNSSTLTIPLINQYLKSANLYNRGPSDVSLDLINGVLAIPQHTHELINRKSKCSNADKTVSTTLKIGASKNQGSGEYVHQGTSTLQEKIDATATIDLSNVEFQLNNGKTDGAILDANTTGILVNDTRETSITDRTYPEPKHINIPILIYIGRY